MTHIIESYLERTTRDKIVPKTKGQKGCALDKKADKNIKYCKSCNSCWEPRCRPDTSKIKYMWYKNFPTYGKEREICPTCQTKNKNN